MVMQWLVCALAVRAGGSSVHCSWPTRGRGLAAVVRAAASWHRDGGTAEAGEPDACSRAFGRVRAGWSGGGVRRVVFTLEGWSSWVRVAFVLVTARCGLWRTVVALDECERTVHVFEGGAVGTGLVTVLVTVRSVLW